jgi:ferredoxin
MDNPKRKKYPGREASGTKISNEEPMIQFEITASMREARYSCANCDACELNCFASAKHLTQVSYAAIPKAAID